MSWNKMYSKYGNRCSRCQGRIHKGSEIFWNNDGSHQVTHYRCGLKHQNISEEPVDVFIEGHLTMHGVKNKIKESGKIWKLEDKIRGECSFNIAVADYGINIPRIVRENIAKIINVNVDVSLKKK